MKSANERIKKSGGARFPFFENPVQRKRQHATFWTVVRRYNALLKNTAVSCLILGTIIGLLPQVRTIKYFNIKNVKITGSYKFVNVKDFTEMAYSNSLNKNIFALNIQNFSNTLTHSFPAIKSVQIVREYPATIDINVQERIPLAVIVTPNQEKFLVDEEGYILGYVSDEFAGFTTVFYDQNVVTGTFLEKELVPVAKQILEEADERKLKVSSLSFNARYSHMYVSEGIETYIGNTKDRGLSMEIISTLLKNAEEKKQKIKLIDLRYEKVIVLYD